MLRRLHFDLKFYASPICLYQEFHNERIKETALVLRAAEEKKEREGSSISVFNMQCLMYVDLRLQE